jgi:hypothetical protein
MGNEEDDMGEHNMGWEMLTSASLLAFFCVLSFLPCFRKSVCEGRGCIKDKTTHGGKTRKRGWLKKKQRTRNILESVLLRRALCWLSSRAPRSLALCES